MIFDTYGVIWVVSVPDGEVTLLPNINFISYRHGPAVDATWSSDGRWIAFTRISPSSLNGEVIYAHLWLVRSDGSGERELDPPWENWTHRAEPSWSPDGSSIAYFTSGGNIAIIDVGTLEETHLTTRLTASDLSWGTDGLIASVGYASDSGTLPSPPLWISSDDRDPGFANGP